MQWVSLGTYDTSLFQYDLQSLQWLDSEHINVIIKISPLTLPIRQRLDHSNTGLHPISLYSGYEYYGYSIREEVIDLKHNESQVLNSYDYDLRERLLEWIRKSQEIKKIAIHSPESVLVKELSKVITYVTKPIAQHL
ncbi:MAG TPA: hypothetical protein VFO76_01570 [Candidatus Kapabacteria bacterium]|nr:hypothetical protein [Candidatus Kapabacteria bacterium]